MGTVESRTVTLRDGAGVVIRVAIEDDAPEFMAMSRHIAKHWPYAVTEPEEVRRDEAQWRAIIARHREDPSGLMLAAASVGGVVGDLSFSGEAKRRMAHAGNFGIAVAEGWRGRGVGRLLVRTLLDWAAAHPVIERVGLGVLAGNERAIALYRSMGFVEEGRLVRQFKMGPGRYVDDIRMYRLVK